MAEKKQELLNIEGVFPDVPSLQKQGYKSIDDLKKTDMFLHIPTDKADAAYAKLWDIINPKGVASSPAISSK